MVQLAHPISDLVTTGWTEDDGDTTNQFQEIDENFSSPNDADYIKTATPPGSNEYECGLTSLTDPVSSSGHIMKVRAREPVGGGANISLQLRLLQTSTQIKSSTQNPLGSSFTDYTFTLSGPEADAITDYTALRFEVIATQV